MVNKIFKVEDSYGSCTFKNEDEKLDFSEIKDSLVELNSKEKGYVRILGSTRVHEHGYSTTEDIFGLITLDYRVVKFGWNDVVEILEPEKVLRREEPKQEVSIFNKKLLNINGFDGSFKYDIE